MIKKLKNEKLKIKNDGRPPSFIVRRFYRRHK